MSERIAAAVVCAVLGVIIAFCLISTIEMLDRPWLLIVVPAAGAVTGFAVGEKAVEWWENWMRAA